MLAYKATKHGLLREFAELNDLGAFVSWWFDLEHLFRGRHFPAITAFRALDSLFALLMDDDDEPRRFLIVGSSHLGPGAPAAASVWTAWYISLVHFTMSEVLRRADEFFMGKSPVHRAATRLAQVLKDLEIPFAIAGALAANIHGYHRTTADVDILLTTEGLRRFKERWLGRGWVEIFPGSKAVRDTEENVKIDILLTGGFPGDGKPKPVAFPDPCQVFEISADGVPVLPLAVLVELKLASGMTAPHRPRDLDDVIQLIRANALGLDYAERLDPYVQEKYRELWDAAQINEDY